MDKTEKLLRELVAQLVDGTRQLALAQYSEAWLWRCESQWFWGGRWLAPLSAEQALHEIQESVSRDPGAEPGALDSARAAAARAALDQAGAALGRLYEGEVLDDKEGFDTTSSYPEPHRFHFAVGAKLYRSFKPGLAPLTAATEVSEEAVLQELLRVYARGEAPKIAPAPEVRREGEALVSAGGGESQSYLGRP
jgi:hypothetical protein